MAIVMFLSDTRIIQRKCRNTESIRLACARHSDNDNLCYLSFRLGKWVSTQRVNYKKLMEGKLSNMTQDRIDELNDIGFIWDPL